MASAILIFSAPFQPMPLRRGRDAFDHPDWGLRVKVRRFRALVVIQPGRGEIVCLDRRGRPQFKNLLFRRGDPCFYAFDALMIDEKDLRRERLIDRKQELRRLLARVPVASPLKYADHVDRFGTALVQRVCDMDLEAIVAKESRPRTLAIATKQRGSRY
jgi:hypothetical protein